MRPSIVMILGLVALGSSMLRFGQRENEALPVSDSDYYLDMARVFAGEAQEFRAGYAEPPAVHHYARPLLPFLAGQVGRHLLGGNYRAAFSLLNLLAAWAIAVSLYSMLLAYRPEIHYPWIPSVLFLTGFPQLNWGYHLLTDTAGYATAFPAALYVARLCERYREGYRERSAGFTGGGMAVRLGVLFVLQSLAFLARETAWMVPVVAVVVLMKGGFLRRGRGWGFAAMVLATLLAAKLPHELYARHFEVAGLRIEFVAADFFNPWYAADFLVKSAVAFHVAWLLVPRALKRSGVPPVPDVLAAWTLAAVLYMAAGYVHNSFTQIGYPLRLTYSLFPIVYLLALESLERSVALRWRSLALGLFTVVSAGVSVVGVFLDPSRGKMTVLDLVSRLSTLRGP
ncbi:MAG: hypothetical protein HY704_01720 [Gemmatimonadetes bacterium]|nr:hypothetical protein [Gemmatimonadota bacterium]